MKQLSPNFWTNLYFTAEATRDQFDHVHVVTLKSHYLDLIYDLAIKEVGILDDAKLLTRVKEIVDSGEVLVCEHVNFSTPHTTVVINRESITDDTIMEAAELVRMALDLDTGGDRGVVNLGEMVSFASDELTLLYKH